MRKGKIIRLIMAVSLRNHRKLPFYKESSSFVRINNERLTVPRFFAYKNR